MLYSTTNIPVLSMLWLMHAMKTAESKKMGIVSVKALRLAEQPSNMNAKTRPCYKDAAGNDAGRQRQGGGDLY